MASRPRSSVRTRIVTDLKLFRWPAVLALAAVAFSGGVVGFHWSCRARAAEDFCTPPLDASDLVYLSLQLFIWQSGSLLTGGVHWTLHVARILAPLAFGAAAFCAFAALFADRLAAVRARYRRGHVIVCGLGARGLAIARHLRDAGWPIVMVDAREQRPGRRSAHDLGAVIVGDAADPATLRRAGVAGARHLVAVCGDDALNAEVCAQAAAETAGRHVLTCHAHVATPALWERLRLREIGSTADGTTRLQFFSTVDLAARAVVAAALPGPETATPHLVVAGGGVVAERTVVHAALAWRFMKAAARLRLTVADTDAAARVAAVRAAHPGVDEVCDVVAREFDAAAPGRIERLRALIEQPPAPSAICLAGQDDAALLAWALGLAHPAADDAVAIVVAAAREQGPDLLVRDDVAAGRRLTIVGMLERGCSVDAVFGGTHELLAQAIHGEYVRAQAAAGHTVVSNPSMQPWSALPERLRESNRQQADDLAAKVASVGCRLLPQSEWDAPVFEFTAEEVEQLARREHARWVQERLDQGWRYDTVKDVAGGRSPHLRDWADLDEEVREVDRVTVRGIPMFLARVGLGVRRGQRPPAGVPLPPP